VRVFPFNRVAVSVLASSRAARVRLEAAFTANPTMRERLLDRLRSVGCDVPDLRVDLAYVGRVAPNWEHPQFHLAFDRVASAPSPAPAAPAPARIEITIVRGAAERRTYTLAAQRIDLGRGAEVRDSRIRLLRTNHVVFTEGSPGENETVSRRHAHMACDTSSGAYRLFDDGSVHGTGIVRDGRTIAVPAGSRGVRVRSGDEIVLGEARIRIRMS
jgi:pSer/pThr/pTyr-binding forkhead associated (FHA) protein